MSEQDCNCHQSNRLSKQLDYDALRIAVYQNKIEELNQELLIEKSENIFTDKQKIDNLQQEIGRNGRGTTELILKVLRLEHELINANRGMNRKNRKIERLKTTISEMRYR